MPYRIRKHLTSTIKNSYFKSLGSLPHREAVCIPHMTIIDPQHIRKVFGQNFGASEKKSHPEKHVVLSKRTHQNTHLITSFDVTATDVTARRFVEGFGC